MVSSLITPENFNNVEFRCGEFPHTVEDPEATKADRLWTAINAAQVITSHHTGDDIGSKRQLPP